MKTTQEAMQAKVDLTYLLEAGAIERNLYLAAVYRVFDGNSDKGLFEILYRDCRMPMGKAAIWANRLRLEGAVRHSIDAGALRFEDAFAYYCQDPSPTTKGLVEHMIWKEGKFKEEAAARVSAQKELRFVLEGLRSRRSSNERAERSLTKDRGCHAAEGAAAGKAAVAGGGEQKNGGREKDDSAKEEGFRHGKGKTKVGREQQQ
jgi:hypothetical protein